MATQLTEQRQTKLDDERERESGQGACNVDVTRGQRAQQALEEGEGELEGQCAEEEWRNWRAMGQMFVKTGLGGRMPKWTSGRRFGKRMLYMRAWP